MCKIGDPSHSYEFVLRLLALIHVSNLAAAAGDGTSRSRHEIAQPEGCSRRSYSGCYRLVCDTLAKTAARRPAAGSRPSTVALPPDCWRPTTANGVK